MPLPEQAIAKPATAVEPAAMQPLPFRQHHIFLLRIWRSSPDEPWRATLCDANQTPRHFASLVELFTGLWEQVNRGADVGGADP